MPDVVYDPKTCPWFSGRCPIALDAKIEAQEKALVMGTKDMDRRLEDMNKFRSQLTEQANTFATRIELKAEAEKLDLKLAPLLNMSNYREGSMKWKDHILTVLIAAAVMLAFKFLHI